MIRQTSIDVYHQIEEEGLLTKRRFEVYKALFLHGPMTQMETARKSGILDRSYTPRFAELERIGVIKIIGKRKCSVTGRKVMTWDVTAIVPVKLEKPKRKKCKFCNGKGYTETQQTRFI